MAKKVLIVGAGVAGLSCAIQLHRAGIEVSVLEASDGPGGRIRTDAVDGFLLDRGFQVLLTGYPECRRQLDYEALDLRSFFPGARVRFDGRWHQIADPWRRPLSALAGIFSPIGTLGDKLRVARLRRRLLSTPLDQVFRRPELSTLEALEAEGFSPAMIERFFRPFLGGIFLEPELATSSRMFEFVFKMFSTAPAALPARGMQQLPEQLAKALPKGALETGRRVTSLDGTTVLLDSGEVRRGDAIVVATDATAAAELVGAGGGLADPGWCTTTCLYFSAPQAPIEEPILVLDGDGEGPINNLCVPSQVSPHYAPEGRALISISVVGPRSHGHKLETGGAETGASETGDSDPDDSGTGDFGTDNLEARVLAQARSWFGDQVESWEPLRSYVIRRALPRQLPPLAPAERPVRLGPHHYVCGDHRDTASIHGAMVSGRQAAEALIEDH